MQKGMNIAYNAEPDQGHKPRIFLGLATQDNDLGTKAL